MLAAHLQRLTRQSPTRYAMHPDLARALSNYLMIHSRAHNLAAGHQDVGQSMSHLIPPHVMPLLGQLFQGVLGGHHEAPGMYLDALQEAVPNLSRMRPQGRTGIDSYGQLLNPDEGYIHEHGDDDIADLLHTLRYMSGNVQRTPGFMGNYSNAALGSHRTRGLVRDALAGAAPGWEDEPASMHLWNALRHHPDNSPPGHILSQAGILGSGGGYAPALLQVHDTLANHPSMSGPYSRERADNAAGLRSIRQILRGHLIPHLHQTGG